MTDDVMAAWTKAFVAAQNEMPEIPKSKTATIPTNKGGSYSYKYADLPAIIDAVRPVLSAHELAFAQSVETTDAHDIAITTRIYHSAGGVQSFGPLLLPGGSDARGAGSAITYGRRYALCAALGIAADEDDDAAEAPKRQQPATRTPAQARRISGGGAATGNGAGASTTMGSPTPSPDDPPLPGDRPCPDCGYEVNELRSSNERAPKWKCSNESCTGHHNKKSDKHEPWVSWSINPWKPGGEVEQAIAASSETGSTAAAAETQAATTEPTASAAPSRSSVASGGDQAATSQGEPSTGSAPSDRQEPAHQDGSVAPSTRDGSQLFSILEQAWEGGLVTLGQAIRASMGPCSQADLLPPGTKGAFADLPDSVLADIVEDLKLEAAVAGMRVPAATRGGVDLVCGEVHEVAPFLAAVVEVVA